VLSALLLQLSSEQQSSFFLFSLLSFKLQLLNSGRCASSEVDKE